MRNIAQSIILMTALLASMIQVCRMAESCDFDDPALKKLCRKVESQEKYLEKIVDIGYKTETVFRWYAPNKEWLTNPRLNRMMKRLLRRAATLNPTESDDLDETSSSSSSANNAAASGANVVELELKLQQMVLQLNQTQAQLASIVKSSTGKQQNSAVDWQKAIEERINASISAQANQTNQSLQHVVSGSELLAVRLSKTEKLLQNLKSSSSNNCGCNSTTSIATRIRPTEEPQTESDSTGSKSVDESIMKVKHEMANEIEQLQLKLQLTANDLEKSINAIQVNSEGALRNFSLVYQEGMKTLTTMLDDRLSTVSSASTDVITNAVQAFGEDLQVLRQAVSESSSQVQYLIGQDNKAIRGFEELRSGARRHENNIQVVTNQLGEMKLQMQDQLNNIRTHFTQTVNEFYNKIVERQNAMSYRLSSVVEELTNVKGRVRNLPVTGTAGGTGTTEVIAAEDTDELPSFT